MILGWDTHPDPLVVGYRIHYGFEHRVYPFTTNVGSRTQVEFSLPIDGERYYFAVTAVNSLDAESPFSEELEHSAPPIGEVLWRETTATAVEDQVGFIESSDGLPPVEEWILVERPLRGSVSLEGKRYRYTPDSDFSGDDTLRFAVIRDGEVPWIIVVWISVIPRDDPPLASSGEMVVRTSEPVQVPFSGVDPDGSALTFRVVEEPAHGTLTGIPPVLFYTPEPGYVGVDRLRFVANDGLRDSEPAVVLITVQAINRPPVVTGQVIPVNEDASVLFSILATDPDGDVLVYEVTGEPDHGTLEGFPPDLIFTPDRDFHGTDRVEFTVRDGAGGVAVAGVTFVVRPVNDPPRAFPSTGVAVSGVPVKLDFSGMDVDGDRLTYRVTGAPLNGSLTRDGDDWYYEADAGFVGLERIEFVVADTESESEASVIEISVHEPIRLSATLKPGADGGWALHFTWQARAGDRYQLVTRSWTDSEGWLPVGEPIVADAGTQVLIVGIDGSGSGALYAVQVLGDP